MTDNKKKMEPWQLILILLAMGAFFGGVYFLNQAVDTKLTSLENTVSAKTDTLMKALDRLEAKTDRVLDKQAATTPVVITAPPAETAPEAAAEEPKADEAAAPDATKPEEKAEKKAE